MALERAAALTSSDDGWEPISLGKSGAVVARRGGVYRKQTDGTTYDLLTEGAALVWLRDRGFPVPEVLECTATQLLMREVPGLPVSDPWPASARDRVIDAVAGLARDLHALPVEDCPFDRRLDVVLPMTGPDPTLVATRPPDEDLVVCHGDLCLPNVLVDPETFAVTGVIDLPRLGVGDRWCDLAIATRSIGGHQNVQFSEAHADRFLATYGVEPDLVKIAYYRGVDEFF